MKRFTLIVSAALLTILTLLGPAQAAGTYGVIEIDDLMISGAVADYIKDSIRDASADGCKFVVIQLNTPGGAVDATRDITDAILSSPIPVVVYTYPKGARAASAGAYIMLSAHIAAMAPVTNIGAMTPVDLFKIFGIGSKPEAEKSTTEKRMERKVVNDMVAYARSLARERNRNVSWAVKAVRGAISSTPQEALRLGVIDIVAKDMPDLVKKLHNRAVKVGDSTVILKTDRVSPVSYRMDYKERFLSFLANPELIFILLILAVAGIAIEFKNPGMIVPGAIGVMALILFLMGTRLLPINVVGVALILLAVTLFVLELKITSYGLLTLGGLVSYVLGAMILFDSPLPGGFLPMSTIIVTAVLLLAFIFIVVRAIIKVHRSKVTTGKEGLVGEIGEAVDDFTGKGKIKVHGEIWHAMTDEEIRKGDEVMVTAVKGMRLAVTKKIDESEI